MKSRVESNTTIVKTPVPHVVSGDLRSPSYSNDRLQHDLFNPPIPTLARRERRTLKPSTVQNTLRNQPFLQLRPSST